MEINKIRIEKRIKGDPLDMYLKDIQSGKTNDSVVIIECTSIKLDNNTPHRILEDVMREIDKAEQSYERNAYKGNAKAIHKSDSELNGLLDELAKLTTCCKDSDNTDSFNLAKIILDNYDR